MKIEDTPFYFSGTSPVEKLRRSSNPLDTVLEDLDLSFLDMLTAVADGAQAAVSEAPVTDKTKEKDKATEAKTAATPTEKPKLSLVNKKDRVEWDEDFHTRVDKDMALLSTDLTATDVQYLKQMVIPNVPIVMGSVPFESVFPADPEGGISYKGFNISPELGELIEKGYKTGRPIRVELDSQSAVVLKIRQGQVSAEFVSSEKGAALAMQQELDDLRNRMLTRNLPVGSLEYKYRDPAQSNSHQPRQDADEDEA